MLGALLVVLATSREASADQNGASPPKDEALAEALFREGKALMEKGDFATACPKLAESQRLDPGTGTLLALALCHEGEGKTATAWAEFVEASSAAKKDGRADREKLAKQKAAALADVLSHVTINLSHEAESVPGLEVKRDGVPIAKAVLGTAMPIDPGEHEVTAGAPGRKPWRAMLTIGPNKDERTLVIPALERLSGAPASAEPMPDEEPRPPAKPDESGSTKRTIGLIVGGVGVVSLGVGGFFGLQALSKSNEAKETCSPASCTNPAAVATNDDAKTAAMVSNIAVALGIVGLGVGGYLFFTAKDGPSKPAPAAPSQVRLAPSVGKSSAGLALHALW